MANEISVSSLIGAAFLSACAAARNFFHDWFGQQSFDQLLSGQLSQFRLPLFHRSNPHGYEPYSRSRAPSIPITNVASYLEQLAVAGWREVSDAAALTKISRIEKRHQFDCDSCRYQFSVTAGTIFHDSHSATLEMVRGSLSHVRIEKGDERDADQAHARHRRTKPRGISAIAFAPRFKPSKATRNAYLAKLRLTKLIIGGKEANQTQDAERKGLTGTGT